jgi:hypothetical protein
LRSSPSQQADGSLNFSEFFIGSTADGTESQADAKRNPVHI